MFEWLEHEIGSVKWPKFHVTGPPLSEEEVKSIEADLGALPCAYRGFLLSFGGGRFFRDLSRGSYSPELKPGPGERFETEESVFFDVGIREAESVYLVVEKDSMQFLPDVIVHASSGVRTAGADFVSWLKKEFARLYRGISREAKRALLSEPIPFTCEELAIVEAREKYEVAMEGVDEYGNVRLRIRNGSGAQLEYLTVQLGTARIRGRTPVCTRNIAPGSTAVVPVNFYKRYPKLLQAKDVQVIPMESIGPEDRGVFSNWAVRSGFVKQKPPAESWVQKEICTLDSIRKELRALGRFAARSGKLCGVARPSCDGVFRSRKRSGAAEYDFRRSGSIPACRIAPQLWQAMLQRLPLRGLWLEHGNARILTRRRLRRLVGEVE